MASPETYLVYEQKEGAVLDRDATVLPFPQPLDGTLPDTAQRVAALNKERDRGTISPEVYETFMAYLIDTVRTRRP